MTQINPGARWTVKNKRMGTVHIVRYYAACRDGEEIDHYEDRSIATAYVAYQNTQASDDGAG